MLVVLWLFRLATPQQPALRVVPLRWQQALVLVLQQAWAVQHQWQAELVPQ
jgi:hypothetical protein